MATLYLVATPIGNLLDITQRALQVLREVELVICEDTRRSRTLLQHYGIAAELISLPAFAEGERADRILGKAEEAGSAALVTDAGTPGISDPGELLVARALERGMRVVPIPGPSAVVAALSASGLPTGRFHFLGFLPRKGPDRARLIEEVAPLKATLVLYESPRRLAETLAELHGLLGDRRACVARELTKVHEELVRGTLKSLAEAYAKDEPLGEVVLLVEGRTGEARWSEDELKAALSQGLSRGDRLKPLSKELAERGGWPAAEVYRLGLQLKKD